MTWLDADQVSNNMNLSQSEMWFWQYARSVYYVLVAITTVGYGDIASLNSRERLFSFFMIFSFIGLLVLSFELASVFIVSFFPTENDRLIFKGFGDNL